MIFHRVTQQEITNAKLENNTKMFNKLSHKFIKQHKTPKFKRFKNFLNSNSNVISMLLSLIAIIISIIALFI